MGDKPQPGELLLRLHTDLWQIDDVVFKKISNSLTKVPVRSDTDLPSTILFKVK